MIRANVGTKLALGFGLALLILVVIGTVAHRSTGKLTETADWVGHTYKVLGALGDVFSFVKDGETGQRGFLLTGDERYLEPYTEARDGIAQKLKMLRELTSDNPAQQRRLEALDPLVYGRDGRFAVLQETIDARKDPARGAEVALQIVKTDRGKKLMDEIRKTVEDMRAEEEGLLRKRSAEALATASGAKATIVYGTLGAFLLLAFVAFAITQNLANPLRELSANAARIAVGDLSVASATTDRGDEVGVLMQTFGRMTDSLKGMAGVAGQIAAGDLRVKAEPQSERDVLGNAFASMVKSLQQMTADLAEGVNVLGASANEISTSTSQLAASATQSAAAVTETTTTVEEVRQTAQLSTQKAKAVSDSAQKAAQIALSGRKSTEDVAAGMKRIRQQMEAIAASMGRLSEQSSSIGQIIATVEDLSAQSNLLAVNAAIEAAKAGEHGRGFGVVAQEVKSLAEQSRQATNQVRNILNDIQKATTTAVLASEQGSKAVEAGTSQTEAAAESIQALTASVSEAAQAATQIAASSQQQLVGVDQVATAMESIKQASTQNVASAKQLETAARNLNGLGQRLKQLLDRYKV